MHLHRPVGRVAAQPVGHVVAHRDLVRHGERAVRVHLPRGLVDQRPQHLALRHQLDERELDALVVRERLAERLALVGVGDGLVEAVLGGAERRRGLADAVLVEEQLDDAEAPALAAEDRRVRHPHVGEPDVGVVGRHVERPQELDDLEPGLLVGDEERGDAVPVAGLAARAGEDQVVRRLVDAGVPGLLAVDDPLVAVAHRGGLHVGGVGAVRGLGDAEREAVGAVEQLGHPLGLLLLGPVVQHQQQADVVADDRRLVLQVVVQPEPPAGEVLADDRHARGWCRRLPPYSFGKA